MERFNSKRFATATYHSRDCPTNYATKVWILQLFQKSGNDRSVENKRDATTRLPPDLNQRTMRGANMSLSSASIFAKI